MRARSKWRGIRAAAIAMCATGAAVMALLVPSVSDAPAHANPSAGFDAGNIIDDALFYDGTAWNAAQIQSFLNQRVPRCTIGDPGKPAGGTYTHPTQGWSVLLANRCLKDGVYISRNMAANSYCKAYAGNAGETAAQVISKVSQACGISPKVLLVMLEKEQSLIQDSFPAQHQLDRAMGYACPDSGPNNSANCDTSYYGFFNQVYFGAWQLKVYKAFPNSYNYRPFQTNRIQWHPNAGCGTSDVWIANWATAALYIYTPYRPNQAALNAGWGTGDACSEYGNRNFYNFYTTWFGNTRGNIVHPNLLGFHNANGGVSGVYGPPISPGANVGIGVVQEFSGGTLYWNPYSGNGAVNGAIRTLYGQRGGVWGYLGYPVGRESYANGGSVQQFERGTAYWTSRTGASAINGAIRDLYNRNGGTGGYLGFPVGVEVHTGGFTRQEFERATVYYTDRTGASAVNGAIRDLYNRNSGARGYFGLPVGVEVHTGGFTRQEFERATVYYTDRTGASAVNGAIRDLYKSTGGPGGYLGLPVGVEVHAGGYTRQEFERGTIYYTTRTGVSAINGAIRAWYLAHGGPAGSLGLPIGREVHSGGVTRQRFERGALAYTDARGVWLEPTQAQSLTVPGLPLPETSSQDGSAADKPPVEPGADPDPQGAEDSHATPLPTGEDANTEEPTATSE